MAPPENTYEMVSFMDNIGTVMLPQQVDSEFGLRRGIDRRRPASRRRRDRRRQRSDLHERRRRACVRAALHRAEELGARIAFCRFTGAAADCLLVSGFTQLFEVVDSVEEAAARLRLKPAGAAEERLHPHRRAG